WRYQYNEFGDLVGTSDARGCGQNFFYDGAGRILGEDYALCEVHHAAFTAAASGADAENLEVTYFYDQATGVPLAPAGWTGGYTTGRAIAVLDRGSATFSSYDGRGRTSGTRTRLIRPVTLNAQGAPAAVTLANRYAPRVYARSMAYDAADRA